MQKIRSVLSSDSNRSSESSHTADPRLSGEHSRSTATSSGAPGQLPVQSGVEGRAEETGHRQNVTGSTPAFKDPHSYGHERSQDLANKFDLNTAEHDHKHLAHKTHEHHHGHEVEHVQRQKEHERHVHHTQLHVQNVEDRIDHEHTHREKIHPETKIHEKHGATKQDITAFAGLASQHKDQHHDHGIRDRQVIDEGETVNERVHHHVHNVVQPILKEDHHHTEHIHTTIPTHHVTHEAPIIHEAIHGKPVSKADFLAKGGQLGSGLHHNDSSILQEGACDRQVDGVGERLAKELGLKSGTQAHEHKADTRI